MAHLTPPDEIIDTLYSAATNFDQWPVFLEAFADEFDAAAAVVHYGDADANHVRFIAAHGMDVEGISAFAKQTDSDPRIPLFQHHPGQPISCGVHLLSETWRASGMNRLLRSMNLEYSVISVAYLETERSATSYGLFRAPSGRYFDENDCLRFGAYKSHIDRTIELQKRFSILQAQKWSSLAVLNEMPLGVILCDLQSRILFINDAARTLSRDGSGLVQRNDELWAGTALESIALREMIRDAAEEVTSVGTGASRGMTLTRANGRRPLQVRVSPIWRNKAPFAVQAFTHPVCAVYITDPDLPIESDERDLRHLFGLTQREAEVLSDLVSGCSVHETAAKIGIAVSTVRSHLKTLFAKTETQTQADLVKLVATSPAWLD